jgi:hypothetical protein
MPLPTYLRIVLEEPDSGATRLLGAIHKTGRGWRIWLEADGEVASILEEAMERLAKVEKPKGG